MKCPNREFRAKNDPKLPFWEKWGNVQKNEKRLLYHVCIFIIHVLAKSHEEILIFDEIRGHLGILQFYRVQTRDSEGPL